MNRAVDAESDENDGEEDESFGQKNAQ